MTYATIVALTLAASSAVHGQGKTEADMMTEIMKGMGGGSATSSGEISSIIEQRLRTIMSDTGTGSPQAAGGPVTIEEIDALNRLAERERTETEFEKARFDRMQLEIQRLMALYEVVKVIEEDKAEARRAQSEILAGIAQRRPKDSPDPQIGNMKQDQEALPRIDSITGIGGIFSAEAVFNGETTITVRPGDITINGFTVEDIRSNHVLIRGPASGEKFRIVPTAPKPLAPPPDPRNGQPGNVIDLSQFPMAQF